MALSPNTAAIVEAIDALLNNQADPNDVLVYLKGPVGDLARRATEIRDDKGYDYSDAFEQAAQEARDPYMEMFGSVLSDYSMDPATWEGEMFRMAELAQADVDRED